MKKNFSSWNHVFAPWFLASIDCNHWNPCLHFLNNVDSRYRLLQQVAHQVFQKVQKKFLMGISKSSSTYVYF